MNQLTTVLASRSPALIAASVARASYRFPEFFDWLEAKGVTQLAAIQIRSPPPAQGAEGKTPAIADHQARKLLEAPQADNIRSKRDRAILSNLLFHVLRREELCKLKVKDFRHVRKGVPDLKVSGKGGKTRYLPLHPGTNGLINDYVEATGPTTPARCSGPFATTGPAGSTRRSRPTPDGIYKLVRAYSARLGFEIGGHALRATAATNALDHQADIAKVQEWLGHANIGTTRIYEPHTARGQPDLQGCLLTATPCPGECHATGAHLAVLPVGIDPLFGPRSPSDPLGQRPNGASTRQSTTSSFFPLCPLSATMNQTGIGRRQPHQSECGILHIIRVLN